MRGGEAFRRGGGAAAELRTIPRDKKIIHDRRFYILFSLRFSTPLAWVSEITVLGDRAKAKRDSATNCDFRHVTNFEKKT